MQKLLFFHTNFFFVQNLWLQTSYRLLILINTNFLDQLYNVWVKKTETNRSSDTLLWFVSVFLTQTLCKTCTAERSSNSDLSKHKHT